ncbi:hypothetical protein BO79DRAFT_226462 [Aspergillus costaricaensis CBS 115574]|uniref:Uncharacterized protein n=1 Tax=Aspergillus costaricaensis CBS 115574 TaxID=1448317 RepID=A0ACD1IL41_9EURO|nr:hypothetical protein BO79DRAFT_226462 [Aspergillus costaricaensis CBS 115574]RAK91338.1 hypothetical protein BO79DRAFT_226462 [Aspergillus costaricaensis CBS 115574]
MLLGLVLFLSHSFFSPFFPFSAGQSQDSRQRRNKVLNQKFLSLVRFGMRKRFGMPKLLRDLLIPRIVTQSSPRFSQRVATVKFRSLPVVDGNRAGTPHEIQTLGHATIPPTSWALTNGYFHRRCRAEANPGIELPALVQKLEQVDKIKKIKPRWENNDK